MSEVDEYVSAVQGDGYKAWKGETEEAKVSNPDLGKTEATPAPQEAPQDGRARNPDGTFAPRTETQQEAPQAPPEPFAGFNSLDPEIQAQFNRLKGERDDLKLRYHRVNGQLSRTAKQRNAQQGHPAQQTSPGTTQAGQAARAATENMVPGAAKDAATLQIAKWEAHARDYPQEAAAIHELLTAFATQIDQGFSPLQAELNALKAQVQGLDELKQGYQSLQQERAERAAEEHQHELDAIAGDNWRQIAGWEDERGNPIPHDKRQWHPEFMAWLEGHDPDIQEHYLETLKHGSPKVAGSVIAAFNRDRFSLDGGEQGGQATTPSVITRRAEAQRDVQPGSRGGVAAPATWAPSGNDYVDAVRGDGYRKWREATR